MKQEFGKYYLRYAWFPKTLDNGQKIWFEHFYEVHYDLPVVEPVYTISRISVMDYLIESIKGTIVNGRSTKSSIDGTIDRMLNAAESLLPNGAGPNEKLY